MSIKVNCNSETEHKFTQICAFVDREDDFYLIDEDCEHIVRLTHQGCVVYDCSSYESVEDFLDTEFGCGVLKIFERGNEYEIIING